MELKNDKLVRMVNISKYFGEVAALRKENFEVGYNEVVGLIGDNGAGKSTLIKILTGVHPPGKGRIYFQGEEITYHSVERARELGIIFTQFYWVAALTTGRVLGLGIIG